MNLLFCTVVPILTFIIVIEFIVIVDKHKKLREANSTLRAAQNALRKLETYDGE